MAQEGRVAQIEILGQMREAKLITQPLFDADNARMRG
jgi:dimethylglycine dehydrogenase